MKPDPEKPTLPDPLRLLISAYAAGDLSPGRRSAAVRLLRHSAEARALLTELKANRRKLRALARPPLPPEFTARLIDALSEQPPIIRPSVLATPVGHRFSRASRVVAAAAVLAAVAIGAYLFGSLPPRPAEPHRVMASRLTATAEPDGGPALTPDAGTEEPTPMEPVEPTTGNTAVPKNVPKAPNKSPSPPAANPLGTISRPPPKLTKVDPPRLLALPVREMESPDARKKLLQEFTKGEFHHIDLFCKDTAKAFDRLQAAVRGRNVKLHVDAVAQDALKRKIRGQFLIYSDDLAPADWVQVLQAVAAADKKAGDGLFDHVVVLPFDGADQKELSVLFGSDLSQPDARRPGAGGADASKTEPKKEVRQAFAASLFPRRTPANSKDVRQFLDGHRDRATGDVAVLLVLRMPSN